MKSKAFQQQLLIIYITALICNELIYSLLGLEEQGAKIDKIMLPALTLLTFASISKDGRFSIPLNKTLLSTAVLISLLSTIFNSNLRPQSAIQLILTYYPFILIVIFANLNIVDKNFDGNLAKLIYLLYPLMFLAIAQFFYPSLADVITTNISEIDLSRDGQAAVRGIYSHPTTMGWLSGFTCLYAVAGMTTTKSNKLTYQLLLILAVTVLILTLRRKSIVAAAIAMLVYYLWVAKKDSLGKIKLLPAVALGISTFIYFFFENFAFLISNSVDMYIASGDAPRLLLLNGSLNIANDFFPLGSGQGTFGSYYSLRPYNQNYEIYLPFVHWGLSANNPIYNLDSYWAMIIAENGYLGFSVICLIFAGIYFRLLKANKSENPTFLSALAIMSFIQIFVESIATPSLTRSPQAVVTFILISLALSTRAKQKQ